MKSKRGKGKKAIALQELGWWILAFAVLVLVVIGIIILRGKGVNLIEVIKNLFKFK